MRGSPGSNEPDRYAIEYGRWDAETEHWEGEWRHIVEDEDNDTLAPITEAEPFAWAEVPALDEELAERHVRQAAAA